MQQSLEVQKINELNLDKRLWNDPTIIVENKPTFLGGIMHGSGNKPPGVVPDKMMYMMHDLQRINKFTQSKSISRHTQSMTASF